MAQDTTLGQGKPGIAMFATESFGGPSEPRYGEGVAKTTHRTVTAGANLDLPIYSVVSVLAGVLALAVLNAAAGAATGTLTVSSTGPLDGETFVVGDVTYTFQSALSTGPTVANEVLIHATPTTQALYIRDAINGDVGVGVSAGTEPNPKALATSSAGVVTIIARNPGDEGNAVVLTEAATNVAPSAATLTGGQDDPELRPYGILAHPVVMTNGQSMSVAFYREGDWDMDVLNWDASYETDESKRTAFEGSLSPGIYIEKKKYNNNQIAV